MDDNASAHALCHTPCVLDGRVASKTTARKTVVVKRAIPQVILNNREVQPITTMYFLVVNCEQDWKV